MSKILLELVSKMTFRHSPEGDNVRAFGKQSHLLFVSEEFRMRLLRSLVSTPHDFELLKQFVSKSRRYF